MRILIFLASLLVASWPSVACSVEEGYRVPTNFELVQKAEVIVLARVANVPEMPKAPMAEGQDQWVTLEPIRVLKGTAPSEQLRLLGWRAPENWSGVPTSTTLWQSHFSAGLGACVRQFYQPGELVVAMFNNDPKTKTVTSSEFGQIFDPFARVVETVDRANDVSVDAVERYVAIQAGPTNKINERIGAAIADLSSKPSPAAQAVAADLQYHLTRKHPAKTWGSVASPITAAASVPGQKGATLYCIAGTPPGIMLESAGASLVELLVSGVSHIAQPAPSNAFERSLFGSRSSGPGAESEGAPQSLYRFVNSDKLFNDLHGAWDDVQIRRDGKTVIGGRPLDALVRWAGQCEKLQAVPVPSNRI